MIDLERFVQRMQDINELQPAAVLVCEKLYESPYNTRMIVGSDGREIHLCNWQIRAAELLLLRVQAQALGSLVKWL